MICSLKSNSYRPRSASTHHQIQIQPQQTVKYPQCHFYEESQANSKQQNIARSSSSNKSGILQQSYLSSSTNHNQTANSNNINKNSLNNCKDYVISSNHMINQIQENNRSERDWESGPAVCARLLRYLSQESDDNACIQWLNIIGSIEEIQRTIMVNQYKSDKEYHNPYVKNTINKSTTLQSMISNVAETMALITPSKYSILLNCFQQQLESLAQNLILSEEISTEGINSEIQSIRKQFFRIFARYLADYSVDIDALGYLNKSNSKKDYQSMNQHPCSLKEKIGNLMQKKQYSKDLPPKSNNSQFHSRNLSLNGQENKENNCYDNINNSSGDVSMLAYRQNEKDRVLNKYSNENTLRLQVRELEKQLKQLNSLMTLKTKENERLNQEKSSLLSKSEDLQFKLIELERELHLTDNSNIQAQMRSGEHEYLIRRHENEKQELRRIIEVKNQEIQSYRIELEGILGEIADQSSRSTINGQTNRKKEQQFSISQK